MKYSKIRKFDIANGPGVRTTLFVSGCTHNCEGCFNKEAQSFSYGEYWTKEIEDVFIKDSSKDVIVGINILGGEPMQQKSEDMLKLLKRLKEETKKPIWLWSGCLWEDLIQKPDKVEILKYVDVLIDGKFQIDKRDLMLKYRGSSNQRIIDVKKSLEENTLKLFNL